MGRQRGCGQPQEQWEWGSWGSDVPTGLGAQASPPPLQADSGRHGGAALGSARVTVSGTIRKSNGRNTSLGEITAAHVSTR